MRLERNCLSAKKSPSIAEGFPYSGSQYLFCLVVKMCFPDRFFQFPYPLRQLIQHSECWGFFFLTIDNNVSAWSAIAVNKAIASKTRTSSAASGFRALLKVTLKRQAAIGTMNMSAILTHTIKTMSRKMTSVYIKRH